MPEASALHIETGFPKSEIEQSIPARFAAQVRSYPDRIAVRTDEQTLSYAALDELSNRVAAELLDALGPDAVPVALLLEQGVPFITAALGTLKAGKIFVPLDPADDAGKTRHTMADSTATLILAASEHLDLARVVAGDAARVLDIDDITAASPHPDPGLDVPPDRPAYIYYTSGSTGRPKGVVDCHRNVLHNIMRYTNNLSIGRSDRLSLIETPNYSGIISSLFSALLNGASICPFNFRDRGAAELADFLIRHKVSIFHSVPVIFDQLAATGRDFPDFRIIRLEGDKVAPQHVALFQDRFGADCVLVNGLGATETGISCQYFIDHDAKLDGSIVPIGYPTEDMEVLLLDANGRTAAPGATAEIAVKSRYLATGYWRRPDLTKQAFLADSEHPGERIYRSGDLGRRRPDGCIEYLGRKDFRAKIRGLWVELEAMETALRAHAGLRDAIVITRDGADGEAALLAYVVPASAAHPSVSELRRWLAAEFPQRVSPRAFIVLDRFPLDANGKINRKALPAPDSHRPALDQNFMPPRSAEETTLAEIWSAILHIAPVGIEDDFFDLGGDSLMAMAVVVAIEKRFRIRLPLIALLENPTIAALALALHDDSATPGLVQLAAGGIAPPIFLFHDQTGEVVAYRDLTAVLDSGCPVHGVQARGLNGRELPLTSVAMMADHYATLIQSVQGHGPYVLGGNCFGGGLAYATAQVLQDRGEAIAIVFLIDTACPLGPFERAFSERRRARHAERLSGLSIMAKLSYVTAQGQVILKILGTRIWRRLTYPALDATWRLCAALHLAPPKPFHNSLAANHIAEGRYHPEPYDGRVALFHAGPSRDQRGWSKLVTGPFEVVAFERAEDGEGLPHIVSEPYIHMLAAELSRLYDEALGRPRSKH